MKLKTLVLISSLIAFSSCEKEEEITINMNELSLDSRLFGNWFRTNGVGDISYSSDGRCMLYGVPYDYYVVRYENNIPFRGRVAHVTTRTDVSTASTYDYYFNGDTLVQTSNQTTRRFIKY